MGSAAGLDEYNAFIKMHKTQLESSAIPFQYWHTAFKKLKQQIFDAGESFLMAKKDKGYTIVVSKDNGISHDDPLHIYLIDHAWTFENRDAPALLHHVPGLLPRMANLMDVPTTLSEEVQINHVCRRMWKYLRSYSQTVNTTDPPVTFWYVMDEFGASIQHSSTPNFRAVPFYYQPEKTAFTFLFPISTVDENDEVTIDYVEGAGDQDIQSREALLVPWTGESFVGRSYTRTEPGDDYFLSGANCDILPEAPVDMSEIQRTHLRVYSDYLLIREYLTHPGFVLVDNEDEADILWLTQHFHDYKFLAENRPTTFINQFPCERVITTKDLLSIVARRAGDNLKWLPQTYNLMTELPLFVSVFQERDAAGQDNHWICKPWNLARALDTTVTNNLDCILRLPFSGPKIAQKYAETPVLYNRPEIGGVKFDIRYVVLLQSVKPLKLYCYKEFFIRFANKPFELDDLWDYEKHFTVMNYHNASSLHHVRCEQFRDEFAQQYPTSKWEDIEADMMTSLWQVFEAAAAVAPPRGMPSAPQARALYAADLILTWSGNTIQPQLLEINFGPDCKRACLYYPEFYNDIFGLFFKNELNPEKFIEVQPKS